MRALRVDAPAGAAWRSHSLRRGGATALADEGTSIESIMAFGRWASVHSARLYISQGWSALTRLQNEWDASDVKRLSSYAAIGHYLLA